MTGRLSHRDKEAAVIGYLGMNGFRGISKSARPQADKFSDHILAAGYAAALALDSRGRGVNHLAIIEMIERTPHLHHLVQTAAKDSGLPDWKTPIICADDSIAFQADGKSAMDFLGDIAQAAALRESAAIGQRLASGELGIEEAIAGLQKASSGAGGFGFSASSLSDHAIKFAEPPPKLPPVLKLTGQQISTAGGITCIAGQSKNGKTAVFGAITAAFFTDDPVGSDLLGFSGELAAGKSVLSFDSEQSPADVWASLARALRRADLETQPENLRTYSIFSLSAQTRLEFLKSAMEQAGEAGGIHAVLIDGVADFATDVNDQGEAIALVDTLTGLAHKYACPIIAALHENPTLPGQRGKMRGHLGSHLERKAESNLVLMKDGDGATTIFSERCRNAHISQKDGPRFKFNDEAGMHISCEPAGLAKAEAMREEMAQEVREIFNTPESIAGLSWGDLHKRIEDIHGLKRSGARKRFEKLRAAGFLKQNKEGFYTR